MSPSQNLPTDAAFSPTDAAGPPSQMPSEHTPPLGTQGAGLLSQPPSERAPPPGTQEAQLFHLPPWLPGLYGYPGPNGQYLATGLGMSAPQLAHGAPPYPPMPPFGEQAQGLWGYGHFPPGSFPGPIPHPGDP
jgi:hypothetical protein